MRLPGKYIIAYTKTTIVPYINIVNLTRYEGGRAMRYPPQPGGPFGNNRFDQRMQPLYPPHHFNYPQPIQPEHPLKGLAVKGVNNLTKTLNHVQSFTNMLESAAPVIEKYKPVVKNLPMMLQMLKAMQNTESNEQVNPSQVQKNTTEHEREGISKPKLYIE